MSIPKEPRQLMINLMYLVLTAMLALNVSAEIINAFFALNKGIKDSNAIVEQSNVSTKAAIDKQVKAYPNPMNQGFGNKSVEAQKISKEFETYINDILSKLVTAAGGPNPKYTDGRPVRYKDKDVTTNMFLNEKVGEQIQKKIEETRKRFIALVDNPADRAEIEKQIALQVDAIPADSKSKTWPEYKFKQMPVAAVMPQLTKLSADAKTSETALLNYFLNKVGGETIKIDNFLVAFAPKKGYINRGDKFEAEVYLAGYSSNPGAGVSIQVNGSGVPIVNGKGQFSESPQSLGKRKVTATGSIRNPLTGQIQNAAPAEFEYEVGESSATVSAEKMNVFYIGVKNPIAVSVAGVSSSNINVTCDGCSLEKKDANNYDATISVPSGEAVVKVSGGGINYSKKFRRKAIPNPVAKITISGPFQKGGAIPSSSFAANAGLIADLENFDFDARCSIQSYSLVRVPRREDPQQVNVNGASNGEAERITRMAKPGDLYQFLEIKARCPGDVAGRNIGSMSFFIR